MGFRPFVFAEIIFCVVNVLFCNQELFSFNIWECKECEYTDLVAISSL
jgi:hypothetical protein